MGRKALWALSVLLAVLVGTVVVTGVSVLPASLVLGPCLKDLTSPVSYRARLSPLGSVDLRVGSRVVRLCYGRPAMRGRTVFGGLVPWESLWRMGANEPTRLYTGHAVTLAGLPLPAGRYSLYAIPHADHWEVFVSRSTLHWGNQISATVRGQEVGRVSLPVERLTVPVETLTVHADSAGGSAAFRLEWEATRILLPLGESP
jgi:hypothetical protein